MAATTKTLTPTNQTISIPAFTDKPDNRLQADSTGKLADAVNVLSEQIRSFVQSSLITRSSATTHEINLESNTQQLVILTASSATRSWAGLVCVTGGGTVTYLELAKGDNITVSLSTNKMTFTFDSSAGVYIGIFRTR